MDVPGFVWVLTIVGIVVLLLFDFVFHVRKAHIPTLKEAGVWSAIYVGIAILFGIGVWIFGGATLGTEYFAGYVTEKALSVDNLFVFLVPHDLASPIQSSAPSVVLCRHHPAVAERPRRVHAPNPPRPADSARTGVRDQGPTSAS